MNTRMVGAVRSYAFCRYFGVGRLHSTWRAIRYLFTGSTGSFRMPP